MGRRARVAVLLLSWLIAGAVVARQSAGEPFESTGENRLAPAVAPEIIQRSVWKWPSLPGDLARRWVASSRLQSGWTKADFNQRGWVPVQSLEASPFPREIVDHTGNSYRDFEPERIEQLQQVFLPFWRPRDPRGDRPVYFRRVFEFTEAFAGCASYVSADGPYEFYVNGVRLHSDAEKSPGIARQIYIEQYLKPGKNVLALSTRSTGHPGHVLVWTDLHQAWPVRMGTPTHWLCASTAAPGWEKPGFVPRGWMKPRLVGINTQLQARNPLDTTPIWHPGRRGRQAVAYFRFPFRLEGLPNYGTVDLIAESAWKLYVNGKLAALEKRALDPAKPRTVDVSSYLRPGWNLVAVKAYNYGGQGALACVPKVKVSF